MGNQRGHSAEENVRASSQESMGGAGAAHLQRGTSGLDPASGREAGRLSGNGELCLRRWRVPACRHGTGPDGEALKELARDRGQFEEYCCERSFMLTARRFLVLVVSA